MQYAGLDATLTISSRPRVAATFTGKGKSVTAEQSEFTATSSQGGAIIPSADGNQLGSQSTIPLSEVQRAEALDFGDGK